MWAAMANITSICCFLTSKSFLQKNLQNHLIILCDVAL